MSFSDILEEFSVNCNDQTIIKGKRSKRPRPSSSDESLCNSPEEDDEDMANCLILLARGAGASQTTTNNIKPADNNNKFTSRKFTETSVTAAGTGGGGAYVYECKTCSRAFPSFQALGGHRASHKKPKIVVAADTDRKKSPPTVSAQSPNNGNLSKSHECSVCGSEFGSGQALGGHMRRHRSTTTAAAAATKTISEEEEEEKKRIVVGLDLDLNLPAPTEDDHDHDQHHRREIEMGRRWWIATTEAAAGLTF